MMVKKCNEATRDIYWRKTIDVRKQMLIFARNLWKPVLGALIGAVLGAALWKGVHLISDGTTYSGYSEFYLDFAYTENGEAYDYYNGYTWNDLMTTDRIAGHTLGYLGENGDISVLERVTRAEILSDIRVLRVTFTDNDEKICSDIQSATEQALIDFGAEAREFEQISVIKSVPPKRVIADDRILQALLLGAIMGVLITLGFMNYMCLLDDSVLVPSDISDLGLRLLKITTADHDDKLEKRLNTLTENVVESDSVISYVDASEYQRTDGDLPELKDGSLVVIRIPYGRATRSALALFLDRAENAGIHVLGAEITEADGRFYRAYYSFADHDKGQDS